MAQTSIITGQYVCIRQKAATVVQRFFAWVIDIVFLGIATFIGLLFVGISTASHSESFSFLVGTIVFLLLLLYPLLMEIYNNGQTIGKALIGIKVTSLDGSKPSKTALTLRWLLYLVDFFMGIGLVFVIFSKNCQRIGDLAAGTAVVSSSRGSRPYLLNSYKYITDNYVPTYPEAASLSMRQVEVIGHLIYAENSHRDRLIAQLAKKLEQHLGIRAKESDNERFLNTIYNDFQYYATKVI